MSFTIKLQRNNSEPIRVDKSITDLLTLTGTLREGTSIIDPVIKIECNIADVAGCNYMTIDAFGRRYFVKDIISVRNNLVEFHCHVDVLSTYKNGIRNNTGIVKRQENLWNLYLNDGSLKIYQNPNIITKEFPNGFNTQEFVFAVSGS